MSTSSLATSVVSSSSQPTSSSVASSLPPVSSTPAPSAGVGGSAIAISLGGGQAGLQGYQPNSAEARSAHLYLSQRAVCREARIEQERFYLDVSAED
ncbi:unnamed protein product [Protopolystoma xenopodis]|uniref:Uncharacterized protein n=1 Tax=Protopolystoma xenopodis TaxID=117903 RepID=A0A3S5B7I2_9PLAT|nr:unnamed protein product [Protopolystoma xenopodis]